MTLSLFKKGKTHILNLKKKINNNKVIAVVPAIKEFKYKNSGPSNFYYSDFLLRKSY